MTEGLLIFQYKPEGVFYTRISETEINIVMNDWCNGIFWYLFGNCFKIIVQRFLSHGNV
jgi:hypothetical protein